VQELITNSFVDLQDSDNPDLRDRGYIYWRLLSTDPAAAKEVVLAEKPLISEETDLIEPSLLDELICHISSLSSVYHKPPNAFIEGRGGVPARRALLPRFINDLSLMVLSLYKLEVIDRGVSVMNIIIIIIKNCNVHLV